MAGELTEDCWVRQSLPVGRSLHAELATLALSVRHLPQEWLLSFEWLDEGDQSAPPWSTEVDDGPREYSMQERYVVGDTGPRIALRPMLADRSVVAKPTTAFYLTAGAAATLYVSSPAWVAVCVGEPEIKLREIALQRASDTWIGANTLDGELCYASRTRAFLEVSALPERRHRILTPLRIVNHSDQAFLLDKVSLPAPYLSLYGSSESSQLWTQQVTMTRGKERDTAVIDMGPAAPAELANAVQVCGPRVQAEKNVLTRAIGALFG